MEEVRVAINRLFGVLIYLDHGRMIKRLNITFTFMIVEEVWMRPR